MQAKRFVPPLRTSAIWQPTVDDGQPSRDTHPSHLTPQTSLNQRSSSQLPGPVRSGPPPFSFYVPNGSTDKMTCETPTPSTDSTTPNGNDLSEIPTYSPDYPPPPATQHKSERLSESYRRASGAYPLDDRGLLNGSPYSLGPPSPPSPSDPQSPRGKEDSIRCGQTVNLENIEGTQLNSPLNPR
jgi:hypothetical protein